MSRTMSVRAQFRRIALVLVAVALGQSAAAAQPLAEDSEALALTALLLRDRCKQGFPALAGEIDSAFAVYRRLNSVVFETIETSVGFADRQKAFRSHYADLVVTESDCRSLPDVFRSPENRIHR